MMVDRKIIFIGLLLASMLIFPFNGANAEDTDSDTDGMPDSWEVSWGFDPDDPSDASLDYDGDGFTNLEEYEGGSNPKNPDSTPDNVEEKKNFVDQLLEILTSMINSIIDIILAPFRAIANIWTTWAGTMGSWYGPIVAGFVIVVVLLMVRLYTQVDKWLDKTN